ncbi:PREDICTED: nitrate reductase [NADH]-like [Nelumbo nucifera]|uniref:Nitrate reductase [NADH]-like n=1 Tax=Nelumbo nucifera TaxID=4432 RepID=A0A1U7ZNY8_NELNU|nr:PREDICTED: nitrate reductase [NADH]-like [Nelumbo nucifera]
MEEIARSKHRAVMRPYSKLAALVKSRLELDDIGSILFRASGSLFFDQVSDYFSAALSDFQPNPLFGAVTGKLVHDFAGKAKVVKPILNNKESKFYTRAEVSSHNKKTDCWIIIKTKVYDVTPYVEEHPRGDAILAHAGDDSTEGFYGPQHATWVFDMVDEFYIGDLEN